MVRHSRLSVHNFKGLLLGNRLTNQSQTLLGASLGREDKILYKWSRSHEMAAMPIYGKNLKNLLLQNQMYYDLETWHVAPGTQVL